MPRAAHALAAFTTLLVLLGTAAAAPNLCTNEADFNASNIAMSSTSTTCATYSNHLLNDKFQASSWANVSCPSFFSTMSAGTESVFAHLVGYQIGTKCCGSQDKMRCHDGSNVCKVSSDFNATFNLGAAGLSSPGTTCAMTDGAASQKMGNLWTNVSCASTESTSYYTSATFNQSVGDLLRSVGAACCGSLAKTRCQTAATTTTAPPATTSTPAPSTTTPPTTPFTYSATYWEASQTCNPDNPPYPAVTVDYVGPPSCFSAAVSGSIVRFTSMACDPQNSSRILYFLYAPTDLNCSGNATSSNWMDRELVYDKYQAGLCYFAHPAVDSGTTDVQGTPGKMFQGAIQASRPLLCAEKLQCGAEAVQCGATTTPAPSTTPAPGPPPPLAKAPTDTKHFVEMAVTMPYTVEQFNTEAVKTSFKKAVASAAGTVPDNVVIVSVKSASRRNSGVVVQTKILAKDAAAVTTMKSTLGSGAALKTKLNAALKSEGLKESTGVTAPVTVQTGTFAAAGSTASPTKWLIAALSLAAFACT